MNDLRFAFRQLWKSPSFTAVAVLTLALGIGAPSAIFARRYRPLQPLPYPAPDRVIVVQPRLRLARTFPFSWPNFQDVARDNHSFAALALVQRGDYTLSRSGPAEKVHGAVVSSDFFRVLGVNPLLGRPFTQEEDRIGAGKVAVIRASLWQRKFGGTPDVLGKTASIRWRHLHHRGVPNDGSPRPRSSFWLPIAPFSNTPSWQMRGNQPGFFCLRTAEIWGDAGAGA